MKRTVFYKGGNALSYSDLGPKDGYPILIQHGLIASINDHDTFNCLLDAGARLICMMRPGYGESSPYVMQNMAEWGEIISVLVEELALAQFDVLGISSGAPYSYAIGYHFPDRVRNLFILSGTPALFDENVLTFWPYPINKQASIAEMQRVAYELFFAHLSMEDRERDEIKDSMAHDCFGIGQDFKIRCRDWGFSLSEVKPGVIMRHSRADDSVPFITAQITASLLPNCRLDIRENDAHFSQEVLDDFIRSVIATHL